MAQKHSAKICEYGGCKKSATTAYHYRELVTDTNEWRSYCPDHFAEDLSTNWIIESRQLDVAETRNTRLKLGLPVDSDLNLPELGSAPPDEATDVAAARLREILALPGDLDDLRADLDHVAAYLEESRSWTG